MKKPNLMLFRMITASKSQFVAVLVIIIVGLMVYTSMNMAAVNLGNTLDAFYKNNNFASMTISAVRIPQNKVDEIGKLPGVTRYEGRLVFEVPYLSENQDNRANLRLVSIHPENIGINKVTVVDGNEIINQDEDVLVIKQFAEAQGLKPGDSISIPMNGRTFNLKVAGIVASPEYIYLMQNEQTLMPSPKTFGIVYISEKLMSEAYNFQGNFNEIVLIDKTGINEDSLIDTIKSRLEPYGLQRVITKEHQLSNSMLDQEVKQLKRTSTSLPIVFLLVAAIILEMMIGRMVKRDRIKIGVMKAIGYSDKAVLFHYAKYSLIAGLAGGFIGTSLGMILAGQMTKLYLQFFNLPLLKAEFYIQFVALAMLISASFCTAAGLIGAKGSLKISPAEAMQSEAPKKGKRIILEKLPLFWKNLTFSWKMVYKNIFRNKKRTVFVLTGVMLTYAMMLFTFTMPEVIDEMMNKQFTEFQRMDYNINFAIPMNKNVINEFRSIIDLKDIEGKVEIPYEIRNGSKSKAVAVIGVKTDTIFYTFKDQNGKIISLPKTGIILSENLAGLLNVKIGNQVLVHPYFPNKNDTYINVSGIIRQSLGSNAYMNIDEMGTKLLEQNLLTGVYINSHDPNIMKKLSKAKNISAILSINDMREAFVKYLKLTNVSIFFMMFFSGVLGFAIVYNATIISLSEREMEFSSLRVLGFSKLEIFRLLLKESNMITFIGILLGIPIGKLMLDYSSKMFSTEMYSFHMTPTLSAGIYATLMTLIFILLALLATYRKISKLDFLQAIKNRVS